MGQAGQPHRSDETGHPFTEEKVMYVQHPKTQEEYDASLAEWEKTRRVIERRVDAGQMMPAALQWHDSKWPRPVEPSAGEASP